MSTPNIPLVLNRDALPISASVNDILIKYTSALAEIQRLLAEVERLRSDRDCEKRLRKDADEFRENAISRAEKAEAELATERARLDAGTILLTVAGERVWHSGVDLRAAIDAAMKENAK